MPDENIVKLPHYCPPWELNRENATFEEYSNDQRYHESRVNLILADVWLGREMEVLSNREQIKQCDIREMACKIR